MVPASQDRNSVSPDAELDLVYRADGGVSALPFLDAGSDLVSAKLAGAVGDRPGVADCVCCRMAFAGRSDRLLRASAAERSYPWVDCQQQAWCYRRNLSEGRAAGLRDRSRNQDARFYVICASAVPRSLALWHRDSIRSAGAVSSTCLSGGGATYHRRSPWHLPGCVAAFLFGQCARREDPRLQPRGS